MIDRRSTSQLWMQTATGRKFYPADIRPADICIEDIAHALSNICRFGGHCKTFYSVAQHSVHVAEVVKERSNTWWTSQRPALHDVLCYALLHDASEAYLGDCVTPLKAYLTDYKPVEERAMDAVVEKFNLPNTPLAYAATKQADRILLVTEARDLLGNPAWTKDYDVKPLSKRIRPWSPALAKRKFLFWFNELTREGK